MDKLPPFEPLDHTADLALRVRGCDLRELLEHACIGLLSLLYAAAPPPPTCWRDLVITASDAELVLQHGLRELLYLIEDEALAPVEVRVAEAVEGRAKLRVGVVPMEAIGDLWGAEVKAVTRHDLQIIAIDGGLQVDLVFDV